MISIEIDGDPKGVLRRAAAEARSTRPDRRLRVEAALSSLRIRVRIPIPAARDAVKGAIIRLTADLLTLALEPAESVPDLP